MCACVCVIGSALTYDPSDSPEGDSGGVSSLETRHCQNVRRSIRAVKEREAKTEREREGGRRSMFDGGTGRGCSPIDYR